MSCYLLNSRISNRQQRRQCQTNSEIQPDACPSASRNQIRSKEPLLRSRECLSSRLPAPAGTVGGNNIATLEKNKAMPFLPQPKCPAEWWSSILINKTIKNHRTSTENLKFSQIQSRRNFRPKFEVGLWSSKNATTDRVALFFFVYRSCLAELKQHCTRTKSMQYPQGHKAQTGQKAAIGPPRKIHKRAHSFGFFRSMGNPFEMETNGA